MEKTGELSWHYATPQQVRGILTRNKISGKLFTEALKRFEDESWWVRDATVYLFDLGTNKAARITIEGPDEFNVKVSSRTADDFFTDVANTFPALLDELVIMG